MSANITGLRYILGRMGSGKTLYAVRWIIRCLRAGRVVVTNIALSRKGLEAYLVNDNVDLDRQLRIIDDPEEMRRFWLYRGFRRAKPGEADDVEGWVVLTMPDGHTGVTRGIRESPGPVDYVIDECHSIFPARSWEKTGMGVTWYVRQHRKLGDSVTLITHNLGDVDKLLRVGVEEYVVCSNHITERLMGFLRGPPWLTMKSYGNEPRENSMPSRTYRMTLDVNGLCACYDTSAGVGMEGGGSADRGRRATGLPVWAAGIPFVLLCAAIWWGPDALARLAGVRGSKATPPVPPGAVEVSVPASVAVVAAPTLSPAASPAARSEVGEGAGAKPISLTACVYVPGRGWYVGLSDGREFFGGDSRVQEVWPHKVLIEGREYAWKRE